MKTSARSSWYIICNHWLSLSCAGAAHVCVWQYECEMNPERPVDRAGDLIMMNQGWEELSGHQPFLSGFPLHHGNSMNSINKTAKRNRDAVYNTEDLDLTLSLPLIQDVWTKNGAGGYWGI